MLLDEIAAFVRVADAGSFTAAARLLGVPKSTLSRAITRLEDATRVRLLARSTRAIALTDEGRAFYDDVAPHVAGLRDATAALGELEEQPQGTLRITAPPDAGDAFLGEALVRFVARYPRIRVEVDLSGRMVNLVEEGFDVAIRASMKLKDSSLIARKLGGTMLHLYASPSYVARRGAPATPEELAKHDCVLFRPTGEQGEWPIRSPEGLLRTVAVAGRIGGNDFSFLRAVIRAGAGIGPLPSFLAVSDVASGQLVRVLPGWVRQAGTMYLVYPATRHVPKKVVAFREFMLEAFRQFEARELAA